MNTYDLIRQAIQRKQLVLAVYEGRRREMCPHVLGLKGSRAQALFYQFAGESRSGLGPSGSSDNWRCIDLSKLTDVSVMEGEWHTAPNHSRPQTCVDTVDVEVIF